MKNKNEIIDQFKIACNDIKNINSREIAVGYQYTRTVWDLTTKDNCLIRIENKSLQPKIIFFYTIDYAIKNNIITTKNNVIEFDLTPNEYNDLEAIFYGKFIPDNKYFKRWGYIYSNTRDIKSKPKWFELRKIYRNYISDIKRKEHLFKNITKWMHTI